MKEKLKFAAVAILLVSGLSNLRAQEVIAASGGEAGGDGYVSYTVGQIFYSANTGTDGNVIAEGVQQPYEIQVVSSVSDAGDITLNVSAYPNPVTEYLILKVERNETTDLRYRVFDINGRLLQDVKAAGQETKIEINNFVKGNYIVKVSDKNKEIKIFKIIKN